jgi:hypothetical protein
MAQVIFLCRYFWSLVTFDLATRRALLAFLGAMQTWWVSSYFKKPRAV